MQRLIIHYAQGETTFLPMGNTAGHKVDAVFATKALLVQYLPVAVRRLIQRYLIAGARCLVVVLVNDFLYTVLPATADVARNI